MQAAAHDGSVTVCGGDTIFVGHMTKQALPYQ
jgi:hypothetical protein